MCFLLQVLPPVLVLLLQELVLEPELLLVQVLPPVSVPVPCLPVSEPSVLLHRYGPEICILQFSLLLLRIFCH